MQDAAGNRNSKSKSLFETQEQDTEVQLGKKTNRTKQKIQQDWTETED